MTTPSSSLKPSARGPIRSNTYFEVRLVIKIFSKNRSQLESYQSNNQLNFVLHSTLPSLTERSSIIIAIVQNASYSSTHVLR
jgi:hypothetical protein